MNTNAVIRFRSMPPLAGFCLGVLLAVAGSASALDVTINVKLPYNIAYTLDPVNVELQVKGALPKGAFWRVYDIYKRKVAGGLLAAAKSVITFKPPRYGWYLVACEAQGKGVAKFVGVTPKFRGVHTLAAGQLKGGWNDMALQAFSGLMLDRTNTHHQGLDGALRTQANADKYGVTLLMQFENPNTCKADHVRQAVTKMKGRVKYWEIMNEPNFSMSPQAYAKLVAELTPIIKKIDPAAKVMGPDTCGVNLGWNEQTFQAGAGQYFDIISIHDYEANESVDHFHWIWKIGQLRQIMKRYGLGDKPIWQTERAIGGVRAKLFQGPTQAIRITLQRDLLQSFGVDNDHNSHYYANVTGYNDVPTFVFSESGPHPAALATRTRHAMTSAMGRRFVSKLDFGATGNKIFLGLLYKGKDGSTVTLRNLGTLDQKLTLDVTGGNSLQVVDSFGNRRWVSVKAGKASITLGQLASYVLLKPGQTVTPPVIDFGNNFAADATFTYSGGTKSSPKILTDGVFQIHHNNPWGPAWTGSYPGKVFDEKPQTLDIAFPEKRRVAAVVIYGVRADNPHSALLDYDLQYHDGKRWVTHEKIRTPCPPSDAYKTYICEGVTWYLDHNFFVHRFKKPVTTNKLRLVVRRITRGFMTDMIAEKAAGWRASGEWLPLREIEVYAPLPPVTVRARLKRPVIQGAFTQTPLTITVKNRTAAANVVRVRLTKPPGWSLAGASAAFSSATGASVVKTVKIVPPRIIPVGLTRLHLELVGANYKVLDATNISLEVTGPNALSPQAPKTIKPTRQPMLVEVSNLTAKPAAGTVTLTVTQGRKRFGPFKKTYPAIPAYGRAMVEIPVPGLDLRTAASQAVYRITGNRLVLTATQNLPGIRSWRVVGPFPNQNGAGFAAVYGPEKKFDLAGAVSAAADKGELKWKAANTDLKGHVDLTRLFKPNNNVCAYAGIFVKSPKARKVHLSAGSDDGIKLWLNGKLAIANNIARGASPGQENKEATLRAGWNEVLLKITQGGGGWGFYFEILDSNGEVVKDLVYATAK